MTSKMMSSRFLVAVASAMLSFAAASAEIRGPFPILSVPYEEDGALDVATLVREARFVADSGVEGFIWCQSNDAIDLLTAEEKKLSFAALAKEFAGEDVVVALGCEGRDTAEMVDLAEEVEKLAAQYLSAQLAIACRPPHDARTQDDLERYYRRLAEIAKRPVIIQTYTSDKVPAPAPELLIRLAREFPHIYGWIKEETGGEDANDRMRRECRAPEIKTVFSAWGSYGWIDQYRNYGTRGVVSERAAYADYLMEIWNALEDGDSKRVDELWAKYLLMMNLKETIPGGHLRGFNLYMLKKRGIFKNYVSREYADGQKTPGKWKLVRREFTKREIAEIEDRWKRMSAMIPGRTFVSKIRLNPGERWFGAAVNLGCDQPWTEKSNTRDGRYRTRDFDLEVSCWGGGVMPFLLSDQGRYVWSDGPFKFRFTGGVLRIESNKEKVGVVQAGKTLRDAYLAGSSKHFRFTGKTPPAEFFTKPQFNNWIEIFLHGVNQDVSEKYVRDLAASGFPCGVFMTDGGWMKYHGAELFDDIKFPDPLRYFDLIRAQGWKSLLWMSPFVSPDSQKEYRVLRYYPHKGIPGSGYDKGLDYLICEGGGKRPAILRWWSGNSAAYDLTNPEVFDYFAKRLQKFASDYHFDGFKFDAGNPEFIPKDATFFRPDTPRCEFGRAYTMLGTRIPYNEFRSGYGTGGQPIVQRLHDQLHAWEALPKIVKDMINAGLVGYPYVVADMIGGGACGSFFPGKPFSQKLMVRSCQLQAMMPMMQFSLAPWRVLDERNCAICKDYANLHCRMGPYIMKWAEHASKTGEPILRSMDYEFPGQGFGDCFTQFMLGPDWLVAPVLSEDDAVSVKLPAGRWLDDLGELHVGPKTLELKSVPIDRLPRFRREGAADATAQKTLPPAISNFEVRRNPALSGKRVMFYIDDVIWLFRDLARHPPERLFDNPFLKVLKEAHDKYGMKVQLNCFYRMDFFYGMDEFTLAGTPDRYKAEWQANKDWLRLGFHSLQEFPDYPFINADYSDMKSVVGRIRDEVRRFAGEGVFTHGAVVHWGSCSKEACRALRDMGFGIVLATCGPRVEYGGDPSVLPYGHAMRLLQNRKPETCLYRRLSEDTAINSSIGGYNNLTEEQAKSTFGTFDYIYDRETGIGFKELEDYQPLSAGINLYALKDIPQELNKVIGQQFVTYSYHEQYFHKDYLAYQPDYAEKVMLCARMLHDAGYEYIFFADLAGGR